MGKEVSINGETFVDAEVVETVVAGPVEAQSDTIGTSVIKFENETVRTAFENFVRNYKGNVEQYLNMVLGNDGVPVDAFISTTGETITVYQQAPDKGLVLAMGASGLILGAYLDVPNGELYGIVESGAIFLYLKEPKGSPDVKLGQFKTLTDAAKDWTSEAVTNRIKEVKDYLEKQKSARENGVKKLD